MKTYKDIYKDIISKLKNKNISFISEFVIKQNGNMDGNRQI